MISILASPALAIGAFFGGPQEWSTVPAPDAVIPHRAITVIIGCLLAIALGGLWSTLTSPPGANERLKR